MSRNNSQNLILIFHTSVEILLISRLIYIFILRKFLHSYKRAFTDTMLLSREVVYLVSISMKYLVFMTFPAPFRRAVRLVSGQRY